MAGRAEARASRFGCLGPAGERGPQRGQSRSAGASEASDPARTLTAAVPRLCRRRVDVRRPDLLEERLALRVEPLQRPRGPLGQRVRRENGKRDGAVDVGHDGVRQPVRVDLAPAHRLAGSRARESARVRARVGDLEEVVVPFLFDPEHFLDLRLGLKREVLGRAASQNQDRALPARLLRPVDDRRGLIDVAEDVPLDRRAVEPELGRVHADRAVARRGRVDGHVERVGLREERRLVLSQRLLALQHVAPGAVVEFRGPHRRSGTRARASPRGRTRRSRAARRSRRRCRRSGRSPARAARRRPRWSVPGASSARCRSGCRGRDSRRWR